MQNSLKFYKALITVLKFLINSGFIYSFDAYLTSSASWNYTEVVDKQTNELIVSFNKISYEELTHSMFLNPRN